jgi:CHAD domain-containing protein
MVRIAIAHWSIHHHNTEVIARAMAESVQAEVISLGEIANHDLTKFDLLGIGSGIFFGKHHSRVLNFAKECRSSSRLESFASPPPDFQDLPMSNLQPISPLVFGSLERRLDEIQRKGSLISHAKSKLGEPIHNFRVDCRKGLAALDFYQSVVPKGCFKRLRSTLRKFLRQSNLGRDLDVIVQALKDENSPGTSQLLRRLKKDRKREFRSFQKRVSKLAFGHLKAKLHAKMLDAAASSPIEDHDGSLANWAQHGLQVIAQRLFSDAHVGDWNAESAHQLRLRIKKLRYSVELATSLTGKIPLAIEAPLLEESQRMLGEINDLAVRIRTLRAYRCRLRKPECQDFLEHQISSDSRELDRRLEQWSQFWTPECQTRFYGAFAKRTF